MSPLLEAIDSAAVALAESPNSHWIVGFSGGKDSTALLKIFASAMRRTRIRPNVVDIIYCDTGVENPVLDGYVKALLSALEAEFQNVGAPIRSRILKAPVSERFFVKIIGRGYPPPTNSFRWCTKNLRIKPVSRFISEAAKGDAIVSLGMRRAESQQRERAIDLHGGGQWQTQFEAGKRYRLFLPILDLPLDDVWDAVFMLPYPKAIDAWSLERLYRGASGECPIVKSPQAPPCASGRFGCWTCTVVRKDRSTESLINSGHGSLRPYLDFRNWLAAIRNDAKRRWPVRRNGSSSLGPFNLATRVEILLALRDLEREVGRRILADEELGEIVRLWRLDADVDRSTNIWSALNRTCLVGL
jgi:DNA sulfur modification protein DndC